MTEYRLSYVCSCGRRPNVRLPPHSRLLLMALEDEDTALWWWCQTCKVRRTVPASAIRYAECVDEAA